MANEERVPEGFTDPEEFENAEGEVLADSRQAPDTPDESDEGYGDEGSPPEEGTPLDTEGVMQKFGNDPQQVAKGYWNLQNLVHKKDQRIQELEAQQPPSVPPGETPEIPEEYPGEQPTIGQIGDEIERRVDSALERKEAQIQERQAHAFKEQSAAMFLDRMQFSDEETAAIAAVLNERGWPTHEAETAYYYALGHQNPNVRPRRGVQQSQPRKGVPVVVDGRMPPQSGIGTAGKATGPRKSTQNLIQSGDFDNLSEEEQMAIARRQG